MRSVDHGTFLPLMADGHMEGLVHPPFCGWFRTENPMKMWMILGSLPTLGNLHVIE